MRLLKCILFATLFYPGLSLVAAGTARPNIVYILADDLGYGDVGCYNPQSKIPTPNMDRLAAQGMRFTDAHTPSGVCTPTRYGVLTGRYAWRSSLKEGVLGGYSSALIQPDRETVASLLKKQGYRTATIGKWHLGLGFATTDGQPLIDMKDQRFRGVPRNANWKGPIKTGPLSVGFDYYFGCAGSWDMPPYAWIENDRLVQPDLIPTTDNDRFGGRTGVKSPGMKPEDAMPMLTKKAIEYIKAAGADDRAQPFFLYFPLTAPHGPVAPNEGFRGKSKAGAYGDFVAEVDSAIGEMMEALEKAGIADRTLLILTSDNGPETHMEQRKQEYRHFSASHFLGKKRDNWEGGHRVPFIARWPGKIPAGAISEEIICLTDLMATCAALTGHKLSPDAGPDSYNILPTLLGQKLAAPVREATVHHSSAGEFAIRQGKWKLLLHPGSGGNNYRGKPEYAVYFKMPVQLYDLADDPGESKNLAASNPDVVAKLTAVLKHYVVEGRSTPGMAQPNDTPNDWKQLEWMGAVTNESNGRSEK